MVLAFAVSQVFTVM